MDDDQSHVPYGRPIRYVFGDLTEDEWREELDMVVRDRLQANPRIRAVIAARAVQLALQDHGYGGPGDLTGQQNS